MAPAHPIPGWQPSTPAVFGGQLDELTRRHPAVAVHFWAAWNGADRLMDRSIQSVVEQFADRVHFASCDVDSPENLDLCRRGGFANIPAVAVFLKDRVDEPIVGFRTSEQLAIEIEARLRSSGRRRPWRVFWRR